MYERETSFFPFGPTRREGTLYLELTRRIIPTGLSGATGNEHLAALGEREALVGERRPQAIAAELLQANAVVRGHGGRGVVEERGDSPGQPLG